MNCQRCQKFKSRTRKVDNQAVVKLGCIFDELLIHMEDEMFSLLYSEAEVDKFERFVNVDKIPRLYNQKGRQPGCGEIRLQ